MVADANIVIGIKGQLEGGKRVKRTLDDVKKSARGVTKETDQLDRQFQKTNKTALLFGRALGALGGTLAVRSLGRLNDQFTVVDTNIKNVTDSAEEYERVFNSLFKTAQDNGDVFAGLAETYQKLNVSLEDSVKQSIDLTKVTELLSRGFAASGTSAQTAAGASLQLTQGLATNFQAAGQELNSIIEGAPLLAKAIAVELGGNGAADLKKFAEQGKLTSEIFLNALLNAEDSIKKFEIPDTIARSVQRVSNEFLRLTGESTTMRSVAIGVGQSFDFVAENLDTMFKIVAIGFGAFAGYIIATKGLTAAIAAASGATAIFNAVLAANPIGLFIAALAAAGAAGYVFRDEIQATIIAAATEVIIFMDKAIAKLRDFKNFATNGIAAASIGVQNTVGLISDEVAQDALLELGNARGSSGTTFDAEALRQEANQMILKIGQKNQKRSAPFIPKIPTGTTNSTGSTGFGAAKDAIDSINRALKNVNGELETTTEQVPEVKDQFAELRKGVDDFANSAGEAFGQIVTGATSAKEAISNLLKTTAQNLASEGFSSLTDTLMGSIFGGGKGSGGGGLSSIVQGEWKGIGSIFGGGFGGIGSSIGSLFGFNSGGDMVLGGNAGVDNNVLSLNGSPIAKTGRGETMSIRPAGVSGSSSSGVVVNQTINISTGVQETVQAEIASLLPMIEQSTKAAIAEDRQRGITT